MAGLQLAGLNSESGSILGDLTILPLEKVENACLLNVRAFGLVVLSEMIDGVTCGLATGLL